jgi:hypothetical protein
MSFSNSHFSRNNPKVFNISEEIKRQYNQHFILIDMLNFSHNIASIMLEDPDCNQRIVLDTLISSQQNVVKLLEDNQHVLRQICLASDDPEVKISNKRKYSPANSLGDSNLVSNGCKMPWGGHSEDLSNNEEDSQTTEIQMTRDLNMNSCRENFRNQARELSKDLKHHKNFNDLSDRLLQHRDKNHVNNMPARHIPITPRSSSAGQSSQPKRSQDNFKEHSNKIDNIIETGINNTDSDSHHKRKTNIPPWLRLVGQKCHSEQQINGQQDLSKVRKRYHICNCIYCAVYAPENSWANEKIRLFVPETWKKHENQPEHHEAERLYKSFSLTK